MYAKRFDADEYPQIWILFTDDDESQAQDYILERIDKKNRGRILKVFDYLCSVGRPNREKCVDLGDGFIELKTHDHRFVALETSKGWVVGYGFKKPTRRVQTREIRRGKDAFSDFIEGEEYRG